MFWKIYYNLCKNNNTTPNAVCAILGLSTATATKWKKTSAIPNGETLIKIADYFNVSADYLLNRTDNPINPNLVTKE